ncbi:MAG TPA: hypothetical protein EYP77_05860 [Anaerolineae bacterium]|nr:hypothetical protein [Anaerolineae bacterium]
MTNYQLRDANPDSRSRNLETALWVALAFVAAVPRLTDLAAAPLSGAEAVQALAAYRAAHATEAWFAVEARSVVPLLFHLNTFLFALFGGGDGLARLVPALAGVGLALTPLLLRRYLGLWGALGTGLLLALSPTALCFSRTLDGTVPAALGVMVLVSCAARFLDTWRSSLVTLGGLGLAVVLTAGPGGWGLLLGLLIALAGGLWVWRDQVPWVWPMVRPALGRGLAAAGLGMLALGTGLGLNPGGLAAVGEQPMAWLARFGPSTGQPGPSPFTLLLGYEPLVLLAGLVGLVLAVRRRHGMGLLWAFWAAVGGLQLALMPGRQPADLLWVLLPLAGLGGLAVEDLARSLQAHGRWLNEGLHMLVSLILWVHWGLALARYAHTGDPTDRFLVGLVVALQVLLTAAFGFAVAAPEPGEGPAQAAGRGLMAALRAGGLSLGLLLLAVTFSAGWGLSHRRPADPRELMVQGATAVEVRTLVEVVGQVGLLSTGVETGLSVTLLGEADPALAWALRRFDGRVLEGEALVPGEQPLLVIAPVRLPPPPGYFGERFPLRRAWTPRWGGQETARWWLYRETATPPVVTEQIVLWVREDLGTRAVTNDQ